MRSVFQTLRGLRARRAVPLVLVALAAWAVAARVAAEALVVSEELGRADALVVLAGSSAYVERTARAAELYREGRAPLVILTNDGQLSGWSNESQSNPTFVERARGELVRGGVPAERIEALPRRVGSTHDEAVLLREYAGGRHLRSLLVVTSGYHSRRALWTFRRAFEGSGVGVGVSKVEPGLQTPAPGTWWLSPRGWQSVAGEYVKMVYYRLSY
ncbi:MAG TPA: YdcF family protein [Pyrinomonadaceae bacterium]|nr:YdcF family protein [Pyrinomonadaceae bacterium]